MRNLHVSADAELRRQMRGNAVNEYSPGMFLRQGSLDLNGEYHSHKRWVDPNEIRQRSPIAFWDDEDVCLIWIDFYYTGKRHVPIAGLSQEKITQLVAHQLARQQAYRNKNFFGQEARDTEFVHRPSKEARWLKQLADMLLRLFWIK